MVEEEFTLELMKLYLVLSYSDGESRVIDLETHPTERTCHYIAEPTIMHESKVKIVQEYLICASKRGIGTEYFQM